mgnify:CR=1 FL=1
MKDKTVLIIDDCAEIVRSTARKLRQYWGVETATTVGEALAKIPVAHVILSDWDMPEGGGAKILEVATVPVVIYTGGFRTEFMSKAAGFIEKPARTEDLDKILFEALLAHKHT